MVNAYLDALKMLARRELSEAQVRQRLARNGHDTDAIEEAVVRLRQERAIDDLRVAETIARTQTAVRHRGRLRVCRQIEQAGISPATARRAVENLVGLSDPDAVVEASLSKRLGRRERIADDAEFRRLHRYLVGQGFESDQVLRVLKARRSAQ